VSATDSPDPADGDGRVADTDATEVWHLRLYVAGQSAKSMSAFANLKKLCEQHLAGRYEIEIIDLVAHPGLARADDVLAVPTLVRRLPLPLYKVFGDLSNTDRVLIGLRLQPESP